MPTLEELYKRIAKRNAKNSVPAKRRPYPKELVSERIRYHMKHLERHPGGRKQAIAIGISEARRKAAEKRARPRHRPTREQFALGMHARDLGARKTRWVNVHVVQGNYGYGHGWEDLTASDQISEAKRDLADYRENEPQYPHRMITRRVTRERYESGNF